MIPDINVVGGEGIPFIQVNGTGIKLIQTMLDQSRYWCKIYC